MSDDQCVLTETHAALGKARIRSLPVEATLAVDFFMSHGARNWPFLTFTTLPVAPAASSKSVWRQRKAGICRISTAFATSAHCSFSCVVTVADRKFPLIERHVWRQVLRRQDGEVGRKVLAGRQLCICRAA